MTGFPPAVALVLLWLPLWLALVPTWRGGQYYEFGWLVVPAALFFAHGRYRDLGRLPVVASALSRSLKWLGVGCVLALFGVLWFLRCFEMVDSTWRRILVPHALLVALATLGGIVWLHGVRVALFFLPVVLFALTAVPIPSGVEQWMVNGFTGAVVGVSAELLRWLGHPIVVHGDVLSSLSGRVEVTESCSGLRSFQSLLMAGLFFGELYRLWWTRRLLLLAAGLVFGFLTNVGRALCLGLISLEGGHEVFDRWHDGVGHVAFILAIGGTFLVARWMESREEKRGARSLPKFGKAVTTEEGKSGKAGKRPVWCLVVCALMATVGVEVAAHAWYGLRSDAAEYSGEVPEFRLPEAGVTELDIRDNVASEALAFDSSEWLMLGDEATNAKLELFRFGYVPGNSRFFMDVTGHSPEDCMGSRGYEVKERFADRVLEMGSLRLSFETLSFLPDPARGPLFVFKTRWIGNLGTISGQASAVAYRVHLVKTGQRMPPGPGVVILASVQGVESVEEAWRFFVGRAFGESEVD